MWNNWKVKGSGKKLKQKLKQNKAGMRNRRIIIAGGGTGGHIFPAVAIAHAIKRQSPETEILFIGAKGKMEMEKVPEAGFRIEGLDITGFNRSSLIKNLALPYKLVKSFFQVRKIFKTFKPNAAIGVGGYSSFPVLKYAQGKGIPTFIHESNSFAGKSNIMLGKNATRIFVAVDGMEIFFPAEKITITGNPVRSAIAESHITREEGIRFFGLDPAKKTILSIGGSLGAKSINEAVEAGLDKIEKAGLQLIWQTGKPYAGRAQAAVKGRKRIWAGPFIKEMQYAYAAGDILISRAGAMAIAEITLIKKPAVFVPFPFAAEDHQTANARKMQEQDAGIMIADGDAQSKLIPAVIALAADEQRQQEMTEQSGKLSVLHADEIIARAVLAELDKGKN
jgi:UDP-N-acetylglucosamine--N-acetylmuramyl-(pentapeptide) pyrophosphoryl-undecaprenol N-acetylglucosamine transferase